MANLIHEYLTQSAQKYPESTAIACENESISYQRLEETTNGLAHALSGCGVNRGMFVPLFINKSVNALKALLSISKADCAYIPLDTGSPAERIRQIFLAAEAQFVLVDDATEEKFRNLVTVDFPQIEVINIDQIELDNFAAPNYANISIDLAYVLFTSGSTGVPKGVMISHQMIIDYIDWCIETYGITQSDRIANHAPLYFDNSTFDIYTALSSGGQLHLVHDALNVLMPKLINWLEERAITVFFCVPSVLSILKRTNRVSEERFRGLRHVIAAGEVLPPEVVSYWMEKLPSAQFTNMYGPTEITVDCTFHVLAGDPAGEGIPIGVARKNMEVYVRQENGALSKELGAEGELAVRGMSVSYGYLNNVETTQKNFVQNPVHERFHDPIYLTGDHARIGEDGLFYYLGRIDQQVKHMGNRIELGEIEAAIRALVGILETAVVFNDGESLEEKFIGALVLLDGSVTPNTIQAQLKQSLPPYMLPKHLIEVSEIPLSQNGKIDRKAALSLLLNRG